MTKGLIFQNKTYHLTPGALGELGAIAFHDLTDTRKSKRRSAVTRIIRLLRIGGLFPQNAKIASFGLGVDCNGERTLMIEVEVRDMDDWREFEKKLPE